jgi:signal transduction histidine kinase/serine phosphatase RsbU (regulator of sigma subunit)
VAERLQDGDGLEFLKGGGAMGVLIREHDWSSTPIGDPSHWPQSLRTATSMCLHSRFPMLIWWGPQLVKIYNDSYATILGDKHPHALGAPGREVWPEIWHVIGPMLDSVLREGRATWSEDQLLVLTRAGFEEETYFTFSYSPIAGDGGDVDGVFCAVTETTPSVLGTRRLRMLAEVTERAARHDVPRSVAAAAVEALERDPNDVPFALLYELVDERPSLVSTAGVTPATRFRLKNRDSAAGWPTNAEIAIPAGIELADPTQAMPTSALVLPLEVAGDQDGWRLVLGVPPRLALDEDLRRFYELLAAAIGTAISGATALENERARAEALAELDRAKNDFFANISHEFRTPLTLMLAPLEDELARRPPGEREPLELAHRNAMRLLRLVNALLDFSRAEAGRIEARPQPLDLAALTAQLAAVFQPAIERAGLELRVDLDGLKRPVAADPELWERILLNLLSNAVKYTFEGAITIRAREEEGHATIEVVDTGVGIPDQHRERVFERFHRVPGTQARSHEGSGIGLALVADLVHAQGGSVAVAQGDDGAGTMFCVTLPLADVPVAPLVQRSPLADAYVQEVLRWEEVTAAGEANSELAVDAPRLLFADDNADMRDYVSGLLSQQLHVEVVADGEQALEVLRSGRRFDLLLSDVMMPRLDGLGLLASIRADEQLRQLPVILLSARAGEEAAIEGLDCGADDYIVKPFTAPELLARVRSTLELSRSRNRETVRQREYAQRMEQLYEREHRVAEALQRSLLPRELPEEPYLAVTGQYIPSEDIALVGGDWYDAVVLGDGSLILTIGDVAGHGLRAASAMGQLRSATRGYALRGDAPEKLLASLNNLAHGLDDRPMATCLVVCVDATRRRVHVASAGHPPGYVIGPDGTLAELNAKGPPLGITRAATWSTATREIEDGSALVLYTDGLIERRDENLDDGFARLCEVLRRLDADGAEAFADELVSALRPDDGFADDVAVLVCRLGPVAADRFELELDAQPASLAVVRRVLRRWLAANDVEPLEAYDTVLAVDESASNVIEHAYGPGEGKLTVAAERHEGILQFDVCDAGAWRGPRGQHRGRGLPTMRRLMHEVDVSTTERGTSVRLVRRLGEPVSDG